MRVKTLVLLSLASCLSLCPVSTLEAAPIHTAASAGDLDALASLLAAGVAVDLPHEVSGFTPWQMASVYGRTESAALLAKAGADVKKTFPTPEEVIDRALKNAVKPDGPGFVLLVARDGKILCERAAGLADVKGKRPLTQDTVFRIGSVTKQFVSAAILLSGEEGKLKTSDALEKFFPGFPRGEKITLHHLLTHTSGIHSYTGLPGFLCQVTKPTTPAEVIASFRDVPPDFAPGASHRYCNSGYFLLGEVVRQVQGRPYDDFLRERVFTKEGMTRTGAHRPGLNLPDEASGWSRGDDGKGWKPALDWHMSQAGGAGELYSTAGDLFRWNEALFHGRVLKPETLKEAHTPLKARADAPKDGKGASYAYGWVVDQVRGLPTVWHNGGLDGFTSELRRFPDQNFTIVVLSNSDDPIGGFTVSTLADLVARQYLWREIKPQPSFRAQPLAAGTKLEDYPGTFDFSGLGVMRFRVEKGKLQARLAAQAWGSVTPAEKDQFVDPSVDARFIFQRDGQGKVKSVTLKQRGIELHGARFDEPTEGKATPAQVEEMAGVYKLGTADFIMRLSPRGPFLLGKLGAQPEFAYYPVEARPDRFFCKAIRVEIEFKRGPDGKVNEFILHQGGLSLAAQRTSVKTVRAE